MGKLTIADVEAAQEAIFGNHDSLKKWLTQPRCPAESGYDHIASSAITVIARAWINATVTAAHITGCHVCEVMPEVMAQLTLHLIGHWGVTDIDPLAEVHPDGQ